MWWLYHALFIVRAQCCFVVLDVVLCLIFVFHVSSNWKAVKGYEQWCDRGLVEHMPPPCPGSSAEVDGETYQ